MKNKHVTQLVTQVKVFPLLSKQNKFGLSCYFGVIWQTHVWKNLTIIAEINKRLMYGNYLLQMLKID
jgi:hypothetical protein